MKAQNHTITHDIYTQFADAAFDEAQKAISMGEIPIGAVIVHRGQIIGSGHNRNLTLHDPSAHAEIMAMRQAAEHLKNHRLNDCDIWVTLEPCAMCAGAISHARLRRLYYAASDPKGGAVAHGARIFTHQQTLHKPEIISGLGEEKAAKLLRDYFQKKRF